MTKKSKNDPSLAAFASRVGVYCYLFISIYLRDCSRHLEFFVSESTCFPCGVLQSEEQASCEEDMSQAEPGGSWIHSAWQAVML